MDQIPFVVADPPVSDLEVKGLFRSAEAGTALVPVDKLQQNLGEVCEAMVDVLQHVRQVGQFHLTEVTVGVEVSAEGGVSFIGTSKVAGQAAITLKFERPE